MLQGRGIFLFELLSFTHNRDWLISGFTEKKEVIIKYA